MSEYSVYFNPPGFDDYPRTVQDTVDHVALNAHVERTDVDNIYVTGSTIPSVEDNDKIWIQTPSANLLTPALRSYVSGTWYEFSTLNRGDIIIAPDDSVVTFPWGESGLTYDMSPFGKSNFTVPVLPTPPAGFIYKYYIGAQISQPTPPVITP